MATKTKKNPVAVDEVEANLDDTWEMPIDLPEDVLNELLMLSMEQGRFLAVSKKTFDYYQDDNQTRALTHATRKFGFKNIQLVDLSQPDGIYRVKIPLRIRSRYK